MKYLIVYAHPNPASFSKAILDTATQTLKAAGHEVQISDLYAQNFQPVLGPADFAEYAQGKVNADVQAEQDKVRWAEELIVIYPVWWAGAPAILKGWIDRVFTHGFAFAYGPEGAKGLLGGKAVRTFSPTGTPLEILNQYQILPSAQTINANGIFGFCGLEVRGQHFFGAVPAVDDATRKEYLAQVQQILA